MDELLLTRLDQLVPCHRDLECCYQSYQRDCSQNHEGLILGHMGPVEEVVRGHPLG